MHSTDTAQETNMPLKNVLFQAGLAARTAGTLAWTSMMLSGAQLSQVTTKQRRASAFDWWRRRWARGLLRLQKTKVHLVGELPTLPDGPCILVSNHRSLFDILVLLSHFEGHFLSKAEVAGIPLIGYAAKKAGTIFVDRSSKSSGRGAIAAMQDSLERGLTVIVFPEGTTYGGDEVRPFKAGAFVAAKEMENLTIIPAGLAYDPGTEFVQPTMGAHMKAISGRRRINVRVRYGEPQKAAGEVDAMREHFRQEVQQLVDEARAADIGV